MNTHEYQAKEILKRYGIPVPAYGVASSVAEAKRVLEELQLKSAVVKIQIHAGGRGKAGGVKIGQNEKEVLQLAEQMLQKTFITPQTGPGGVVAHKILLSAPVDIRHEYYVGCVIDRERGQPTIIVSPEGGVEIEEVAAKTPERILSLPIDLDGVLPSYRALRLAKFMGWEGDLAKSGMKILTALAKAFMDTDASLLEINPLVLTPDHALVAVDAKLSVDDNALFRQPQLAGHYDPTQQPENEVEAKKYNLAYIALDGEIGCMVNGAGLAMATMDIIQLHGRKPANFLDVGGSADKETVAAGFKIILSDPRVKAVLVNIFGGIMNCTTIAYGIIAAVKGQGIRVPLVVRMEGTHVERGSEILKESGLNIITAHDLTDAARKVVQALE